MTHTEQSERLDCRLERGSKERCFTMGSLKHPRVFSRGESEEIRAAFHDILDVLAGQETYVFVGSDDGLRTLIIRELMMLASRGTSVQDWKSEVLKALPLR